MRILLRKFHGALCAIMASGGAGWVRIAAPPPALAGIQNAAMHANMLAGTWLIIIAIAVCALLALAGLLDAPAVTGVAAHSVTQQPVESLSIIALAGVTTFDPYDSIELTEAINSLVGLKNGLHATFFKRVKQSPSDIIAFDVDEKKRYRAPYVHPRSAGKPRNSRGFRTDTFKPAYIKPWTVIDPDMPTSRSIGEVIGGNRSPQERIDAAVTRELEDHRDFIDRRLEEQAFQALKDGKLTITGDDYPSTIVDFGRHSSLNIAANTLATTEKWDAPTTADPLANFRAWNSKSVKAGGSTLRHYVFDDTAYELFRKINGIDDKFNVLNIDLGKLNLNEVQDEGLLLRGEIEGSLIYTYDGWYIDDSEVEQKRFTGGYVIGIGAIDGITHYGAIKDFDANFEPMPIFTKMWTEKNPSGMQLLSQCAPLVVPQRINASLCAKVA